MYIVLLSSGNKAYQIKNEYHFKTLEEAQLKQLDLLRDEYLYLLKRRPSPKTKFKRLSYQIENAMFAINKVYFFR